MGNRERGDEVRRSYRHVAIVCVLIGIFAGIVVGTVVSTWS